VLSFPVRPRGYLQFYHISRPLYLVGITAIPNEPGNLPNAAAMERFFRVNNEATSGRAVFAVADGFLVFTRHGTRINATKFGTAGAIVSSKDLNCGIDGWIKTIVTTADGGYLIGGNRNASPQNGWVLKLASDLAYQWGKRIGTGYSAWVGGAKPTADGGTIALVRDHDGFGVIKWDASGNVQWQKRVYLGTAGYQTDVYDIYENTYLDGASQRQCGGYILYGAVQNTSDDMDWDLYLAALSCDGNTLLWQRRIGGSWWEGSAIVSGTISSWSSNLAVVQDANGTNTQNANLAVAASSGSFDNLGTSVLLIPLTISGATTLNTFTIGTIRHLNSADDGEYVRGPYGGPNFLRLSDGNLLVTGESDGYGNGEDDIFLVKLNPAFGILWQTGYSASNDDTMYAFGLSESATDLQVAAVRRLLSGNAALFMQVSPTGANSGEYLTRLTTTFTVTDVSPTIYTPSYALESGTMTVSNETCTAENVSAALLFTNSLYLPLILR